MEALKVFLDFYIDEYHRTCEEDKCEYEVLMNSESFMFSAREELKESIIKTLISKIKEESKLIINLDDKKSLLDEAEDYLNENNVNSSNLGMFFTNRHIQIENYRNYNINLLDKLVNQKDKHIEKVDCKFLKYESDEYDFLKEIKMILQYVIKEQKIESSIYTCIDELKDDLIQVQSILATSKDYKKDISLLNIDLKEITYFDIQDYLEMIEKSKFI